MKLILTTILCYLTFITLLFLSISFYHITFDISKWSENARYIYVYISMFLLIISSFIYAGFKAIEKP